MASQAQVAIALKMIDKASGPMNKVASAAKKIEANTKSASGGLKAFGAKSKQVGGSLTRNLTLPILAIGAGMVKTYADFDATLTNIEARTGATAEQMEKIRKVAIDMGRDTAFSATQASEAMLELMTSGSSVEESIATLPHVLNLASAGMLELGTSSDIVTDILAQFQLEVESSEMVVDALAAGAQSSSASVQSLADGFKNVGPIAKMFGMSVSETTAALAALSEAGQKGAEGGTNLKSMLTNMSRNVPKVTKMWKSLGISMFDATGAIRPLDSVIKELNVAMDDMTDQERITAIQTLAGSHGQVALTALLAADGLSSMQDKMNSSQTAAQVAKKQMESFNGAVNQLKGSMQTFAIVVIGPFVENVLQPLVMWFTKGLNIVTDLASRFPILGTAVVALGVALAVIGPLLWAIGASISIWATMSAGIAVVSSGVATLTALLIPFSAAIMTAVLPALTAATTAFTAFWAAITGPIGIAVLAFAALLAVMIKLNPAVSALVDQFGVILREGLSQMTSIIGQIIDIIKKTIGKAAKAFVQIGSIIIMSIAKGIHDATKFVIQAVSDAGNDIISAIQGVLGIASPSKVMTDIGQNIGMSLNAGVAEGVESTMEEVQTIMTEDGTMVGESFYEGIEAVTPAVNSAGQAMGAAATVGVAQGVANTTNEVASSLRNMATQTVGGLKDALASQLTAIPQQMENMATDMMTGFMSGVQGQIPNVQNLMGSFVDDAIGKMNTGFEISSPSKVTIEIGKNVGLGFREGVEQSLAGVGKSINSHIKSIASGAGGVVNSSLFEKLKAAITGPDASAAMVQQIANVLGGGGTGGAASGSVLDQLFQGLQSGAISGQGLAQLQALINNQSGGGSSIQGFAPSQSMQPLAANSGKSGGVYIDTLNVPPGTTKEQVRILMKEIGKATTKRGVST